MVAILLHWIMAVLIIGMLSLGKYMVSLNYYDQWYHSAPWWHKSFGIAVFTLLIARLGWRLGNATPESLQSYKAWEIKIARLVHILFYALLFIICLSGYFISTSKGAGIEVFGLFDLPPALKYGKAQADIAGLIHEISTFVLFLLIILHAAAALKHHLLDKDITLIRMLKPVNLGKDSR